jgi:uncharacterized protein YbjQ (UPF0145 family)
MSHCPNCGAAYKESLFGGNKALSDIHTLLINEYREERFHAAGYCQKCGNDLASQALGLADTEIRDHKKWIEENIWVIPILTIENVKGWDYEAVGIVSAQSVTGTGVLSDLSADFNDLFGSRSNTLSNKLKKGEDFCKAQLRMQAIEEGCHAVIGVDIDYSEVGSLRGMMMVCMAGTAVRLNDLTVLGVECSEGVKNIVEKVIDINRLLEFKQKILL